MSAHGDELRPNDPLDRDEVDDPSFTGGGGPAAAIDDDDADEAADEIGEEMLEAPDDAD